METETTILAWHWAPNTLRTCYSDEPIVVGQTLTAKGPLELCENGMHASLCPLDALQYAPGSMLCRVELSGEVIRGNDKLCARNRKVVAIYDADHMLHEFSCLCAERALKAAKVDDKRCYRAIEVKRLWLAGKASNAELDASGSVAWAAAWAARGAAWDAVWAAAWAAGPVAWDAVWAARGAAWGVAWGAAWAAGAAERKWQRETLNAMIATLTPIN